MYRKFTRGGVELGDALRAHVYAPFTGGKVRVTAHGWEQVTASGALAALKTGARVVGWPVAMAMAMAMALSKAMAVVGFTGLNQRG